MWKTKAPPQLVVLLWHHFCYYKRHKTLLAFSVLLPFIILGLLSLLVWQLNVPGKSALGHPFYFGPTQQQTVAPLSSGVLQYIDGGYSCYQYDKVPTDCDSNAYVCSSDTTTNQSFYSDESLLHFSLNSTNGPPCDATESTDGVDCSFLYNSTLYKYDPSLALMTGYILYYPNQSELVMRIVRNMAERLETYRIFKDKSNPLIQQFEYQSIWQSVAMYTDISKCWIDLSKRFMGFATRDDLLLFSQNLPNNQSSENGDDKVPWLWGAINFEKTDEAFQTQQFSYSMMHEAGSSTNAQKDIWLQDLIEAAAVNEITNNTMPISVTFKELPTKCWIKPNDYTFTLMLNFVPPLITIAFFLMPVTFLTLAIIEKYLRLSEYLYIFGINDSMLKFSWILFYMLFLLPISLISAVIIYYTPANVFANSDPSILFVVFVAYNLSQLCWCYFLASVMISPNKVRFIIAFVNVFLSVFTFNTYNFAAGQITGSFLTIIRVLSLQASTPFNLALCYVVNWESIWVGAKWEYFFDSPNKGDGYRGFGECILWMLGDSVLYILLGWYAKHVLPNIFGITYPWYFFMLPSYWCPNSCSNDSGDDEPKIEGNSDVDIEPLQPGTKPGVTLHGLSKKYVKDKYAVDNLSMVFNKQEITAFLGENGAGKTTTMSILVGLRGATSGTARIHGMNVAERMPDIRHLIGFVPQYDILYPDLTVGEHITFYGWLKGMGSSEISSKMETMLKKFGLSDQVNTIATKLSGGQKRKLSIIIAYISSPQVIILDEPTSGVDPYSRRAIWEMILMNRQNCTTILSTHYMEEADLLSDRVAIISAGELKCAGTGMYLKNRYAHGYRLIMTTDGTEMNLLSVESMLQSFIPEIKLLQERGNDKSFSIPIEATRSPHMIKLLEHLEDNKEKYGVTSFGISEPTLEDVFFKSTGKALGTSTIQNYGAINIEDAATVAQAEHTTGASLIWSQFSALVWKRMLNTFYSPSVCVMQFLLPLAFVGVMLLIGGGWAKTSSKQEPVDVYGSSFQQNILFFQDHSGIGDNFLNAALQYGFDPLTFQSVVTTPITYPKTGYILSGDCSCYGYCDQSGSLNYQSYVVPSSDLIYPLDSAANVTDWILRANQSDHWIIGGFEFYQLPLAVKNVSASIASQYNITTDVLAKTTVLDYVVVWTSPLLNTAMLNVFNNLLVRAMGTNFSIILHTEVADLVPVTLSTNAQAISAISSATTCYFLIMAYIFSTFGLSDILVTEKLFGTKQLQFIAGAYPAVYWCANWFWDIVQFTISTAGTFLLLGLVPNIFSDDLLNVFLILLPFSLSTISFIYIATFIIDSPATINRILSLSGLLAQVIATIFAVFNVISDEARYVCEQKGIDDCPGVQTWVTAVSCVLCLFPYYYLAESVTYISLVRTFTKYNYFSSDGPYNAFGNLLSFSQLGRRIMEGWIMAIILSIAVIVIEYKQSYISAYFSRRSKANDEDVENRKQADADVEAEENKVLSTPILNDPLVVRKVVKIYPKEVRPAVNGVSFSIPRAQCFGLLGINGAGKTSLFRMLTGFAAPTSGTATLEGIEIKNSWRNIGKNMSYCPQDNTLFNTMNPTQHITLFGKLRGLKPNFLQAETTRLLQKVGLEKSDNKLAYQLSGGNKRKLQLALSLLDYRPLLFLDEPTTGMDPTARRMTWNCIRDAIGRGCSVVLTSHSMEECEELCHRLVIMVLGNFRCIGSVQYLKDKFGNKYTFKIRLSPSCDDQTFETIKKYYTENFEGATLMNEQKTLLVFEIPASQVKLSALFSKLLQSTIHNKGSVEDFSMSQVTLEHVFVSMAEREEA